MAEEESWRKTIAGGGGRNQRKVEPRKSRGRGNKRNPIFFHLSPTRSRDGRLVGSFPSRNGGGEGGSGIPKVTYLKVFPVYQVFPLLKDPLGTVEKRGREREKCNCRRERKINGNIHVYLPFRVPCSLFQKALEFLSRLSAHISNSLWHPFTFFSSPPSPRLPSGNYLDTSTALASPSDNFGTLCSTLLQIPVFHFLLSLSLPLPLAGNCI